MSGGCRAVRFDTWLKNTFYDIIVSKLITVIPYYGFIVLRFFRNVNRLVNFFMEEQKTMGSRIKFLRENSNLKQSEVAAAIGISISQYSNIETGYVTSTKLQTAIALADFFKVSLDFITGRDSYTRLDNRAFVFDFNSVEGPTEED